MIEKLAIIGVGMIGSSLSLALKQVGVVSQVIGYGRSRHNLERALELGVIDRVATSVGDAVHEADMIVVAVPLGAMHSVFAEINSCAMDKAIITDVGSAKASVVAAARTQLSELLPNFVPGHPIAGKEKTGVDAGVADLYQKRRVILTPVAETDSAALAKVEQMWQHCGAIVEFLEVDHHDLVLAATSHLPHMLAYALVHHLSHLNGHEEIFRYAAGGFRDFSRIASSDPVMWRDVCLANGTTLVDLISQYQRELNRIGEAIKNEDADELLKLFSRAKSERDLLIGHC